MTHIKIGTKLIKTSTLPTLYRPVYSSTANAVMHIVPSNLIKLQVSSVLAKAKKNIKEITTNLTQGHYYGLAI